MASHGGYVMLAPGIVSSVSVMYIYIYIWKCHRYIYNIHRCDYVDNLMVS